MRFFINKTARRGVALSLSIDKNRFMSEKENFPEDVPSTSQRAEIKRRIDFELDLINTKINPEEIYYPSSIAESERTLKELEAIYLNYEERLSNRADGEVVHLFQSEGEESRTLERLDGVIAVTNSPVAHELRRIFAEESS